MRLKLLLCLSLVVSVRSKGPFLVNLCCPYGQVLVPDPEYPEYEHYETCGTLGGNPAHPLSRENHNTEFEDLDVEDDKGEDFEVEAEFDNDNEVDDHDEQGTTEINRGENFTTEFPGSFAKQIKEWETKFNIILKSPEFDAEFGKYEFKCPGKLVKEFLHQTNTKNKYFLRMNKEEDLELRGENIDYIIYGQEVKGIDYSWKRDEFCVSFSDIEYVEYNDEDYEYFVHGVDGQHDVTFATCYNNEQGDVEVRMGFNGTVETEYVGCNDWLKFLETFKPIAFGVSIFFLLLTLAAYFWLENINVKDLNTRMTISFVINLTIAYCVSIATWTIKEDKIGTPECAFIGYLTQYFFLSSMFWINSMGFNLWKTFNFHTSKKRETIKRFLKYCLYAQGMPLLISISTAIADASRPDRDDVDKKCITPHYPNMGDMRCFVGEMAHPKVSYLGSAKFIYMDVFMLVIQIANAYFLGSICLVLFRGWNNQARLDKITGNDGDNFKRMRQHATIIIRLFIILGVPWIFEVISTAIAHDHGDCAAKWPSFFMDFTICLAGLMIFLTLVVKRTLINGMKQQMTEVFSSNIKSTYSTSGTSQSIRMTTVNSSMSQSNSSTNE